ncbi:DNA and RNA helicase [Paenibacillus sp. IHBB 10380]|uniref:DNA and RNA helicase n=1 Tax=Paenibacillus sp. IHBB 10380 TaxID=1566358 RepID=UPI0005CFBF0E|nr:DNA and RNA helicase [Paenibacillus sp. IHBB 10380]AJS61108.1 DNA and RNA helicase [Paenibacillus sp. IHBB 10380]
MFTYLYPQFNKGRILKTEMLTNLRDFPREFVDIHYADYSDGIVTGANLEVGPKHLIISPGIVRHEGRLYTLNKSTELAYLATGKELVVKIRFLEVKEGSDLTVYTSEIVLDEQVECKSTELELGRFKLKEGARLRQDYQNFADFTTEYNTLNVLHTSYAAHGESTVSPLVMRYFADQMLRSGSADPRDLVFAMMCANEGIVSRSLILHYISGRMGIAYKDYTHVQIHKHLSRILDNVRSGGKARGSLAAGGPQRVIVD